MGIGIGVVIEMRKMNRVLLMLMGSGLLFFKVVYASEDTTLMVGAVVNSELNIYVQALYAGVLSLSIIAVLWLIIFRPKINHRAD
jgi:hypothetical protein